MVQGSAPPPRRVWVRVTDTDFRSFAAVCKRDGVTQEQVLGEFMHEFGKKPQRPLGVRS